MLFYTYDAETSTFTHVPPSDLPDDIDLYTENLQEPWRSRQQMYCPHPGGCGYGGACEDNPVYKTVYNHDYILMLKRMWNMCKRR